MIFLPHTANFGPPHGMQIACCRKPLVVQEAAPLTPNSVFSLRAWRASPSSATPIDGAGTLASPSARATGSCCRHCDCDPHRKPTSGRTTAQAAAGLLHQRLSFAPQFAAQQQQQQETMGPRGAKSPRRPRHSWWPRHSSSHALRCSTFSWSCWRHATRPCPS